MPSSRRMLSRFFLALEAVRKKTGMRLPIATVVVHKVAADVKKRFPKFRRLHLVGSRLRHKYARDLDFVAVVEAHADAEPRNILDVTVGPIRVNLFVALPLEVEASILEFGLGADILRWKLSAVRKGLTLNRYGLWRKGRIVTHRMAEIAAILGMPLKPELVYTLENPL